MKKIILLLTLAAIHLPLHADLVLSDTQFFEKTGIPILKKHPRLNMAVGRIEKGDEERVHNKVHEMRRCGGFELLPESMNIMSMNLEGDLATLEKSLLQDKKQKTLGMGIKLVKNDGFANLATEVSSANLRKWVEWMQAFGTRYHKASNPNRPVVALEQELKKILKGSTLPYEVTVIPHSRTQQSSVRVRLTGKTEPTKKIILGAHFDSIAGWFGGGDAPGADDNASGSANLMEVLRILSVQPQMNRTVELFWYAGEEGGLIGSAEIARNYKNQGETVLAVMQLDMTLFPGDGAFKLGSVTDFTTPWVREFLMGVNTTYFNYEVNEFECGYGCSDHASWYKNGFATVAPFEARLDTMNSDIHSSNDRIQPSYNFDHSAAFSKLALVFALELDRYTP